MYTEGAAKEQAHQVNCTYYKNYLQGKERSAHNHTYIQKTVWSIQL